MRFVLCSLVVLPLASSAVCEVHVVRPDGTGDFPTIQAAINAADWGDVIELADGEFTGDGNRDVSYQGKPVTVRSQSGNPEACVINCEGSPEDEHRGFDFSWGEGPQSVLEGVTITGGYVEFVDTFPEGLGGGARVIGPACTPTFRHVIFLENLASGGAGILIIDASPTMTDCVFIRNDAWWGGGGGAWVFGGNVEFTRCDFIENHGYQIAGGAEVKVSHADFTQCMFLRNNIEHGYGGGLGVSWDCQVDVVGCTFAENSGAEFGTDISVSQNTDILVRNSTLYGGSASYGCAVHHEGSGISLAIENTLIAFNANQAIDGSGGSTATLSCCNLYGNGEGNWIGSIADQLGQNGNIELDPLFCDAENGDFGLLPESPCAPFSEPNPECDLIGAWPVGCSGQDVKDLDPCASGQMRLSAAPNPFQSSTRIFCSASGQAAESVTLTVMDPSGRRVQTLQVSDSHPATWNGTDRNGEPLPGGIYFVVSRTDGHASSRRIVLIR